MIARVCINIRGSDLLETFCCDVGVLSLHCSGIVLEVFRARPLTLHPHLHMHFYIRDANADAWKCPTHPGITEMWMKKSGGGAKLPAFPRFMHGACYQLKTNNFIDVLEIIG